MANCFMPVTLTAIGVTQRQIAGARCVVRDNASARKEAERALCASHNCEPSSITGPWIYVDADGRLRAVQS